MPSIQLQIRKTDSEFIEGAYRKILAEDGSEWVCHKLWFKKLETMDKQNSIFCEYAFDSIPEKIKELIDKPEIKY